MKHVARRVVTGHDSEGRSVIASDGEVEAFEVPPSAFANRIWATDAHPADNLDARDGAVVIETLATERGAAFYIVDWAPNSEFPEHRTATVDYGVVLSGELQAVLDSGEVATLRAGDAIVQRGTAHRWRNSTDEWCRTAFVLVGAAPVVVDGAELTPTMA
ncbi:cupin domain-containing protein [Tsukamurella sp. NPDC003166]|uniref:cupin domain-containing protein n=1 Tax=Tsukamurella sp. NPDC003166 TaxID=3154444 RepID=UPI0033BBC681